MDKFALVRFIGNQQDYIFGKNCDDYKYCRDCEQRKICNKEKGFHFIKDKEYKAFFLDFCQGARDVLEVENANGTRVDYVPLEDFQVIDDKHGVLQDKRAFVKCVVEKPDLTLGKTYIALKSDENNKMYYVWTIQKIVIIMQKNCLLLKRTSI